MSTGFDNLLIADSAAILADMDEAATYRPRTGSDRVIRALVTRNPPARPDELQQGVTPSLELVVRNDAALGIAIDELDTGGDSILLKLQLGDNADTAILLPKPDTQDAGILVFRIGKRK